MLSVLQWVMHRFVKTLITEHKSGLESLSKQTTSLCNLLRRKLERLYRQGLWTLALYF